MFGIKYNNLILFLILAIIIFLLVRINTESTLELFDNDITIPYGDILIKRNGDNLSIYNFKFNTNKLDLINGVGANCLPNGEISVRLENPKRLETIYLDGLTSFNLFVSDNGEKYELVNDYSNHTGGYIHNISNKKQAKVIGRYFKIVNASNETNNNVKLELYGSDNANSQKISMINGNKLRINIKKEKTHYLATMPENDDHLLYYLRFKTNCDYVKILYKHLGENKIYKLPCGESLYNTSGLNTNTDGYTYIFFPHPTLARNVHIGLLSDNESIKKNITNLEIYGKVVADKSRYIEQSRYYCDSNYTINDGEMNTPNIVENFQSDTSANGQLLKSFTDTEKLCEALEYQENIKSEKLKIEKNKIYMLKLLEQEQEINNLINVINKLKASRDKRTKADEILKLSMYEQQKQDEAQVQDLVEDRLKNQQKLSVNVNMQPYRQ